ncbi:MAG: hypothetical protein ACOVQ2_00465 [Flavobacterium sp.]
MIKKLTIIAMVLFLTNCSVEHDAVVDKFLGTYKVTDECGRGGTTIFEIIIQPKNENVDEVIITNFGGYNGTITAKVDNELLTFNDVMGNLNVRGTGLINSSRKNIQFTYATTGNNITDNCSSNAVKH